MWQLWAAKLMWGGGGSGELMRTSLKSSRPTLEEKEERMNYAAFCIRSSQTSFLVSRYLRIKLSIGPYIHTHYTNIYTHIHNLYNHALFLSS